MIRLALFRHVLIITTLNLELTEETSTERDDFNAICTFKGKLHITIGCVFQVNITTTLKSVMNKAIPVVGTLLL